MLAVGLRDLADAALQDIRPAIVADPTVDRPQGNRYIQACRVGVEAMEPTEPDGDITLVGVRWSQVISRLDRLSPTPSFSTLRMAPVSPNYV
ncbi:MAG: hypothetical protein JNJ46_28370 [Myxococcales bacterium]|nr:hypothetical protein [Myxococcales bacterium]